MRIAVDIGHPAHVHYFRRFIRDMERRGHSFLITARNKEVSHALLEKYGLSYVDRGKGADGIVRRLVYMLYADAVLYRLASAFKPDLFLSFCSPYAAQVSRLTGVPHISLDDTEHARLGQMMYRPFTDVVLTPSCYTHSFPNKQIRFQSFMELSYLHPRYFQPDRAIWAALGLAPEEQFVVLRFVAWKASHDAGHGGLSTEAKEELVAAISANARVYISAEGHLPAQMERFRLNVSPDRMHDVLNFASLYVGEGATMASECAMLGTPAIYVNTLGAGSLQAQEEQGLLYHFRTGEGVREKSLELLDDPDTGARMRERRQEMLSKSIDVTAFLVWFVENYPESATVLRSNPDYQYNFL